MKKLATLIISMAIIVSSVFCAALAATLTKFPSKFIKNFRDCDNYTETIKSEFEGRSFTTTRHIIGWRNGFCRYEETITSPTDSYKIECKLSAIQVDELYEAMKSKSNKLEVYELDNFAQIYDEKTKTTDFQKVGTQQIKGNKAYIAWAKYQNNPYFCRPTKLK